MNSKISKQLTNATESDPVKMGWMVGTPPPIEKLVQYTDMGHYTFPKTRWSFANFRSLVPTKNISRGDGAIAALPLALRGEIDALRFVPTGCTESMTWTQSLEHNYTDAILVLHKGRIAYERYFGVMKPHQPHMSMSVTKSILGTLGAALVADGFLDERAIVSKYIPELKDSAYQDATVRHVLDMRIAAKYSENYAEPDAEIWQHMKAGSVFPRPPSYNGPNSFYDFLQLVKKDGEHGYGFHYKTLNSDVLGWLISRATRQSICELLSERVWSKLGAEDDAYMLIDSTGTEFAGGGFNATLRDMARFGEMMRLDGYFNGQQIIPKTVVDDIRFGGNKEAFALGAGFPSLVGYAYRNMWWASNNEHGAYIARGIHGQSIYIDPQAEMVIVRFASHPVAQNIISDPTTLPAFHRLAKHLITSTVSVD
jgi:CubicO group peptidase (beta-lactamase class C family)